MHPWHFSCLKDRCAHLVSKKVMSHSEQDIKSRTTTGGYTYLLSKILIFTTENWWKSTGNGIKTLHFPDLMCSLNICRDKVCKRRQHLLLHQWMWLEKSDRLWGTGALLHVWKTGACVFVLLGQLTELDKIKKLSTCRFRPTGVLRSSCVRTQRERWKAGKEVARRIFSGLKEQ